MTKLYSLVVVTQVINLLYFTLASVLKLFH